MYEMKMYEYTNICMNKCLNTKQIYVKISNVLRYANTKQIYAKIYAKIG